MRFHAWEVYSLTNERGCIDVPEEEGLKSSMVLSKSRVGHVCLHEREGGRKGGREEGREGGREGGRKGGREEGREGGREGGRKHSYNYLSMSKYMYIYTVFLWSTF